MAIKDALLPEYDHEMGTARKLLERLPEDKLSWRPHDRSMTMARLATHVAELPGWTSGVLAQSVFDFGAGEYKAHEAASRAELLEIFDKGVAAGRTFIDSRSDPELMAPWTLKRGSQEFFTMPKIGVIRTMLLNHLIHHRGQLSVYLRLNNVPVPAIYGPSADEAM